MSRLMRSAIPAVLLLMVAVSATAQDLNVRLLGEEHRNAVQIRAGAEYGFIAGIGYSRSLRVAGRRLIVFGDLTMPWAELDAADYRVKAGVLASFAEGRRWKLIGKAAPLVRGIENELSRMTNLGLDAGVVGGWYGPRWFLSGEVGLDWAVASHIAHTDLYRSTSYPDAQDGWYASPGGNVYYGLVGDVAFQQYGLMFRVGQTRDTNAEVQLLPFYGTLGFNVRF